MAIEPPPMKKVAVNTDNKSNPFPSPAPLTGEKLERLEQMSSEELIALVRASNAEYVAIGMMSQEEIKINTRVRLAQIALRNKDDKIALQAIQQLLDRLEGKPVGAAPQINIGGNGGGGQTKINVILVDAAEYRKEQAAKKAIEAKIIENQ